MVNKDNHTDLQLYILSQPRCRTEMKVLLHTEPHRFFKWHQQKCASHTVPRSEGPKQTLEKSYESILPIWPCDNWLSR